MQVAFALGDAYGQPTDRLVDEFSIAVNGDLLLLPVAVDGDIHYFALDTGSSTLVFDSSLRPKLGRFLRSVNATTPSGRRPVKCYECAAELRLGSLRLNSANGVVCADLQVHTQGHTLAGLIGMDCLTDKIIEIDFDNGKLRFLKSAGVERGHPVPLIWHQGRKTRDGPFAVVTVGRHGKGELLIDTGCTGPESGMLSGAVFKTLADHGQIALVGDARSQEDVDEGQSDYVRGRVKQVSLTDIRHTDLVFRVTDTSALGLGFLSRHIVVFDFPNSVMFVRPGKRADSPDIYDLSGMSVRRKGRITLVYSVVQGSAAENAGIKRDDEIRSIDSTPVDRISIYDLRRLLCSAGLRTLTLMRDNREMKAQLRLAER